MKTAMRAQLQAQQVYINRLAESHSTLHHHSAPPSCARYSSAHTMKLLVLACLLAALLACAAGSPESFPACRNPKPSPYQCPYEKQHECGVTGKRCRYGEECCNGPCNYECQPIYYQSG